MKVLDSKSSVVKSYRGFESHPLRLKLKFLSPAFDGAFFVIGNDDINFVSRNFNGEIFY